MKAKALKIALVVKSLDPKRGGHEYYINRLLRGLLAKGYEIWCFAENFSTDSIDHPKLSRIAIRPCKIESSIRMLSFNRQARRLVEGHEVDFDLVFTTGNISFGDVYRAGGGVHETYMENCLSELSRWNPKHLVARSLQRKLFKENTLGLLITNSIMVKKDLKQRYGVPEEILKVIRNGIDLERFNPVFAGETREAIREQHGFEVSDFICLFTAGGGKRKGLAELLKALASIHNEKVKLLIVGRTDEADLNRTVKGFGLEERVVYAGFQTKIEQYYGAADCFVFPSKYDAAANVVCEALASGVPVITTETNGSHELIEVGKNGFVIPTADDSVGIARGVEALAAQENRSEMRDWATETGQHYSMERHIAQFEAALTDYLSRRAEGGEGRGGA